MHGIGYWRMVRQLALRRRPLNQRSEQADLRKRLTAVDMTYLGVGATVGSAIYSIAGVAAKPTGPAVCLSFFVAACSSIFPALCYAELATKISESGSVYLYAYTAFGELPAIVFALNLLVDFHFGAALGALSMAEYLHKTLQLELGRGIWLPQPAALCVPLLAILTGTLCVGVEYGLKRVNGMLVLLKLVILAAIILAGLTRLHMSNLRPFAPFGMAPVLSMSTTCTFAYIGFGVVANASEECVDPGRAVPFGIVASLVICALLYVTFSLVLCSIVPFRELNEDAPVSNAFGPRYANMPWVCIIVDWGAIVGLCTTLLAGMYSQARIYLALARDGMVPRWLSLVSPTFGTPVRLQIFCGLIATALAVSLPLRQLVNFLNIGSLSSYTVACSSVLTLRAVRPGRVAAGSILVAGTSLIAACTWPLLFHTAQGFGPWATVALLVFLAAVVVASWLPLWCENYSMPVQDTSTGSASFTCPCCPLLPLLGITMNGYLMSQCHWEAWLRLLLTTVAVVLGYLLRVRHKMVQVTCSEGRGAELQQHAQGQ